MYFFGSTTSVVLIKFLIARVGKQEFNPYASLSNCLLGLLLLNTFIGVFFGPNLQVDFEFLFEISLAISIFELIHVMCNMIRQCCGVLNIPFFSVYDKEKYVER